MTLMTANRVQRGEQRPHVFPLVRHPSRVITPALVRMRATPYQVSPAALAAGLASAALLAIGTLSATLAGAACFLVGYVLDNADGEVARLYRVMGPSTLAERLHA